ncbi:nitric oxide reductase activation protein NorD [Desulfofustis limnaeus]|uniref:VWFA domain-containing protein n=1 Tax=Desulfofustis limnaeus TaxID=2740163 RepID=A0ABM7W6V0_9BACT|nr:VWA domain-containing protein [Desulfofustis limnaeus]BDD86705.1 hypothetical protein DPPLL_10700 [Desulfofustis limnaeus]
MNAEQCKELLYELVYPSHPNEWEIDGLIQGLAGLDDDRQQLLFGQVQAIWPISHSLCLAFLDQASRQTVVPEHLMGEWIRALLAVYESRGLAAAQGLLTQGGAAFLADRKPTGRVSLERVSPWLLLFLHGLAGTPMDLAPGATAVSDGATVFLPSYLDVFDEERDNKTLYKFLTALHWALYRQRLHEVVPEPSAIAAACSLSGHRPPVGGTPTVVEFFALFPMPLLAADLFFIEGCRRAGRWLVAELPGLARQWREVSVRLALRLLPESDDVGRAVHRLALAAVTAAAAEPGEQTDCVALADEGGSAFGSDLVASYRRLADGLGAYTRPQLLDILGKIDFSALAAQRQRRRVEVREAFVLQVAQLLSRQRQGAGETKGAIGDKADGARIIAVDREEGSQGRLALQIDNHRCELPEEVQQLAAEISQDLGGVPDSYLAAAVGIAGGSLSRETGPAATTGEVVPGTMAIRYDEWDYRRRGYRKDWCTVYEKEVLPVQSTFVAATRTAYRGELTRLRHQFEMMRINECFVGRQKEGDELDLDAVVEARADRRAGTAASDNLFVRLVRNERDLVTLFLVDMSNSTQGWVGKVIKAALVLLCEAMEAAGDRYGMYGFSGMRRSRCEVFPIKRLDEPYREAVARRIGSIAPRDYTRIGPAIRFGIDRLRRCEARTRLLVTITDGKPEDYDDYKGDYAIEDTRKALLEARGSGLHAFGVAVDRQARDYLPRIFGRSNYLVIDQVEQLPMRLTELYRQLTS